MDALHVSVLLHECIDNLNIRPDGHLWSTVRSAWAATPSRSPPRLHDGKLTD